MIAFDFQEALSFEGETGPYVQYAAVRARNIFRKLEERGEALPDFAAELTREAMARQLASEDFWQMLLAASKADSAVERAVTAGEPAHVAKYAFQLAQAFNNFYHQYPVLAEPDRERKVFLLWMTDFFRAAAGANAGGAGHRGPGIHVDLVLDLCFSHSTPAIPTSPSASSKSGELVDHRRLRTVREQTSDEWGILLSNLLRFASLDPKALDGIIISSVVPPLDSALAEMARRYFDIEAMFVTADNRYRAEDPL